MINFLLSIGGLFKSIKGSNYLKLSYGIFITRPRKGKGFRYCHITHWSQNQYKNVKHTF